MSGEKGAGFGSEGLVLLQLKDHDVPTTRQHMRRAERGIWLICVPENLRNFGAAESLIRSRRFPHAFSLGVFPSYPLIYPFNLNLMVKEDALWAILP